MQRQQNPRFPLLLFAAALAAISLARGAERQCAPMAQPNTVTVTDKDKDARVRLAPGDLLVVRLEAPLGEGYLWQITRNNEEQLKPLAKAPQDKLGKAPPSKVELQVFYLRAESAGSHDLDLEYKRPTDKDAKPAKTFKVTVQIEK
jgi:predicted secreted protein